MLKFSNANAKTEALKQVPELAEYLKDKRKIYSLDLLSGYSCPYAEKCLSKATFDISTGKRKIKDGLKTEFRCFSASQEVQYNNVYNLRKHNFDTLRQSNNMDLMLMDSLPKDTGIVRIHVAGDFFSPEYMWAWWLTASENPDILFYAYTKSLRYWIDIPNEMPILDNFILTASYGGRDDYLIDELGLRSTKVVFSEAEAEMLGLEIDHDDSHAARPSMRDQDFALLVHGTQPKGSEAAEALKLLKKNKVKHSYNRKKKIKGIAIG
tara:strand:- start:9447 stop:10244 length:798 start_codon:yes stop_codon:yes gene_type:complete